MAPPLHPADNQPASRETLYAILGSVVISIVLTCLFVGNPFTALADGYRDYTQAPAGSASAPVPPAK
jgi:hypothetical protein